MAHSAKIRLSEEEKRLVENTSWIFSKRLILKKVEQLLSSVQAQAQEIMLEHSNERLHQFTRQRNKIARGENYKGLPWLMLDFPAHFHKTGVFAVRSMFWWGNYFSSTLHISGKYLNGKDREEWIDFFANEGYLLAVGDDEWENELSNENYLPAATLRPEERREICEQEFFKAAIKISLECFPKAREALLESIRVFLRFCNLTAANSVD